MEGCYLPNATFLDHDLLKPSANRTVDEFNTRRTMRCIDKPGERINDRDIDTQGRYRNDLLRHFAALVDRREYLGVLADEWGKPD